MFMVVIGTFEWATFRMLRRVPRSDAFVIVFVTVVTLVADLAVAVLSGVVVSALVFAWESAKKIQVEVKDLPDGTREYDLHGALFFGSTNRFRQLFDPADDPQEVVIDFADSRVFDHSGIEAIQSGGRELPEARQDPAPAAPERGLPEAAAQGPGHGGGEHPRGSEVQGRRRRTRLTTRSFRGEGKSHFGSEIRDFIRPREDCSTFHPRSLYPADLGDERLGW